MSLNSSSSSASSRSRTSIIYSNNYLHRCGMSLTATRPMFMASSMSLSTSSVSTLRSRSRMLTCFSSVMSCRMAGTTTTSGGGSVSSSMNVNAVMNTKTATIHSSSSSSTKSFKSSTSVGLRRIAHLARQEVVPLCCAAGMLVVSSSVSMAVPFAMGKIIDMVATSGSAVSAASINPMQYVRDFSKILGAVFVIGGLANFGRVWLIHTTGQRIISRLRKQLMDSLIKQDMEFFDKNKTGELVNRLSADTQVVGSSVTNNMSDGLRASFQFLGGVGMMVSSSPQLTATTLVIVPSVAIVAVIYGRYIKKLSKKVQDALAETTAVAEERMGNMRTVRAFVQEETELRRYSKAVDNVYEISCREATARAIFYGFAGMSGNMIMLAVLWHGGSMMVDGTMTVGDLTSFLLYSTYVGISVGGLSSFYAELMKGVGASERLWHLLDHNPTIPSKGSGDRISAELLDTCNATTGAAVEFRDIDFAYPTRLDAPVFSGLSLNISHGEVTAIVGTSGGGKSTLAALLLRFYDPQQGKIFVAGRDITELDPTWLRDQVGIVSQEPVLFSGTIEDNIRYGRPDASTSDVERVSQLANAQSFIETFPDGMKTRVGERGQSLSGGQKQRVAIARALLKNPRILILDEATSALDAQSESLVQEALERLMVGRTTLVIAHRLSTIRLANTIAVLDNGCVAEIGTYSDLYSNGDGIFRNFVDKQTME